jgi:hypothetical protein
MEEIIKVCGLIRIRELPPEWTEADFRYWWLPEVDSDGRIIRKARMSEREKSRWTQWEGHNLLTSSGRSALLTYMSSNTGSTYVPFAAYLAIGSTSIVQVYPTDTNVPGEFFRKQPTSTTQTGNNLDVSTSLAAGDAVGTWSNLGLYGGAGVSGTIGSGVLYTHSLVIPNYTKGSNTPVIDYTLSLN